MKKTILAVMLAVSSLALAQPAPAPNRQQDPAAWQQWRAQRIADHANRLAQKLGLDASAAQRFQAAFQDFANHEMDLHKQMRGLNQTLRAAAKGDSTAQSQVESTVSQLRSLRAQQIQLQDSLFDQLSNGLSEQQKAKLVLILERHMMHARFGHHGHRGPGEQQPPQQQPQQ